MLSKRNFLGFVLAVVAAAAVANVTFAAAGQASPPRYVLHAGDQLAVQVYGEQALPQNVTVLPGGDIFYPLAGRVHVAGLTPDQAASALTVALQKYIRQPIVSISVVQQGQINVLVLGNVKTPGKYQLSATAHTTDAIAAAGGLGTVNGDFPTARIIDAYGNTQPVDLQKLLHDGDASQNVVLTDNATVYVPAPETFDVEVFGSVSKPGDVTLNKGDNVAMAIARAGPDTSMNPDLNRIQVKRTLPDGQILTQTINLYQELQSKDLTNEFIMQKGDIVYVPQAKVPLGKSLGSGAAGGILLILQALSHL